MKTMTKKSDIDEAVHHSMSMPVLLFIHSRTCHQSAAAQTALRRLEKQLDIVVHRVVVQEAPEASAYAEEISGIKHESPQVFLYHNGRLAGNWDHGEIDSDTLFEIVMQLPST